MKCEINIIPQALAHLKGEIQTHKVVREAGIKNINVLLVGEISSGKSSFFNTVESVFAGYVTTRADTGTYEHSLTKTVIAPKASAEGACILGEMGYCYC